MAFEAMGLLFITLNACNYISIDMHVSTVKYYFWSFLYSKSSRSSWVIVLCMLLFFSIPPRTIRFYRHYLQLSDLVWYEDSSYTTFRRSLTWDSQVWSYYRCSVLTDVTDVTPVVNGCWLGISTGAGSTILKTKRFLAEVQSSMDWHVLLFNCSQRLDNFWN